MDELVLYTVSYAQRVRDELVALVTRARALGLDHQILAAVREIDRRLRIFPQFGDPLRRLTIEPAELRIGIVPPVVVHDVLDEERRSVNVLLPFRTLRRAGL